MIKAAMLAAATAIAMAAMAIAGPAEARPTTAAADSKALDPIIACRALTGDAARLACYDSSVGALQTATAKHDIVVIDQQDVARARRSLFGFSLPNFDFLGGSKTDDAHNATPEDSRLTATLRSAQRDGDGNWILTLDDGAVWHQTTGMLAITPKPGEPVEIKRAAFGSYFMRVGKQVSFKAKRES
jgi:hypothetical protein